MNFQLAPKTTSFAYINDQFSFTVNCLRFRTKRVLSATTDELFKNICTFLIVLSLRHSTRLKWNGEAERIRQIIVFVRAVPFTCISPYIYSGVVENLILRVASQNPESFFRVNRKFSQSSEDS